MDIMKPASMYAAGDDVWVASPREGEPWPKAFTGELVAFRRNGRAVVMGEEKQAWEVPVSRLRRPTFAVTNVDEGRVSLDHYGIDDRVDFLKRLTRMVVEGVSPSFVLAGDPGIGKSHTVKQAFEDAGMTEGKDFMLVKARLTAYGLYKLMYQYNGQPMILDDADGIWKDENGPGLLKAALDSYDDRIMHWQTNAPLRDGFPQFFTYTGRVVFISNLDISRMDAAVVDRSIRMNFTMNNEEVLERLYQIWKHVNPGKRVQATDAQRMDVLKLLEKLQDVMPKISIRTMINGLRMRVTNPDRWEEMVPLFA